MRYRLRRAFNLAAVVSALLFAAASVMWAHGHARGTDGFELPRAKPTVLIETMIL